MLVCRRRLLNNLTTKIIFIKFLCIFKLGGNITNSIPDTSIWAIDVTSYKNILKSFLIELRSLTTEYMNIMSKRPLQFPLKTMTHLKEIMGHKIEHN